MYSCRMHSQNVLMLMTLAFLRCAPSASAAKYTAPMFKQSPNFLLTIFMIDIMCCCALCRPRGNLHGSMLVSSAHVVTPCRLKSTTALMNYCLSTTTLMKYCESVLRDVAKAGGLTIRTYGDKSHNEGVAAHRHTR